MTTLATALIVTAGVALLTVLVVATVGVLSYWIGRASGLTQTDRDFAPGNESQLRAWTARMAAKHGVFILLYIRDVLDQQIKELERQGYDMNPQDKTIEQ